MAQKISVIGYGNVGSALGKSFQKAGLNVTFGVRDPGSAKVSSFAKLNQDVNIASNEDVFRESEVVVLVTPPDAAIAVAKQYASELADKVLIDCTNQINDQGELVGGVGESMAERIAAVAPDAKVVKCFNTLGFENFADSNYPGYGELKPAMLLCGDDDGANQTVAELASSIGFEPCVIGGLSMSHYIESWAMIWIIMARFQGKGSDFAFAMLKR